MSILMSLFLLQATAQAPGTAQVVVEQPDDAKVVCKTVTPTGSRLGGKRVCMPKRDWRRVARDNEEATKEIQGGHSNRERTW